ncbi:VCBS repeat-containing protein [Flagellimonas sp.]|uniref:VCBS repeat-containing protein n=1 Tax=Flagellimonas sp. TaxID=2058762 RepID=UPI003B50E2DF
MKYSTFNKAKIVLFCAMMVVFLFVACMGNNEGGENQKLFRKLDKSESGIEFSNKLTENDSVNYFNYGYMYMGGGVAVGDLNNDGLQDLYFTGNMVENQAYLNQGNLKFKSISESSPIIGDNRWYTGVTMVDINADGFLDIYVSASGIWNDTKNQLFINQGIDQNGVPVFQEMAEDYGIADDGNSVQAYFVDFDKDGDLDLYVINYPVTPFNTTVPEYVKLMKNVSLKESNSFYVNNGNGTFTDMTEDSGLLAYNLSLSASIGDYNRDGWPDIYVSNDFASPDNLYINQGDGTFLDQIHDCVAQTSFFGMGSDVADFNNDGWLDIFQLDMTPEDNRRSKANMQSMNVEMFENIEKVGFQTQYMQNALQLNIGNSSNGLPQFSNIPRLAGVSLTDWSWAPLFADFDNDGWKDLFVTNGTRREINNKDFFKRVNKKHKGFQRDDMDLVRIVEEMPSEKIENYAFKNNGDYTFEKAASEWGVDHKGFSNGTAYADLDNDGDLDLVLNNLDEESFIYENSSNKSNNYLGLELNGPQSNRMGIGTKVTIHYDDEIQFQEVYNTRGFQSSVPFGLHFGLGNIEYLDSITVEWPNNRVQKLYAVQSNQKLQLNYENGIKFKKSTDETRGNFLFADVTKQSELEFKHQENDFDDYFYQVLLPHKMSILGPALAVGDINNDGLEDFFVGGASGKPGILFEQFANGTFKTNTNNQSIFEVDILYEDVDAQFVDLNNDGLLDLYVVSGGNEFYKESNAYQDRLYINKGNGNFSKLEDALPRMYVSGSVVRPGDFDKDGDLDLFVGGRHVPRNYPLPTDSYILRNDSVGGQISFVDVTNDFAKDLRNIGMVTDASWVDFDNNSTLDLVVVGVWMPITFLSNENGILVDKTKTTGMKKTNGWWNKIHARDFDADGDMDFVVGNLGLNYKYRASGKESFDVYADDFDNNKSIDIVLGYYNDGIQYPVRGRQCSAEQIPAIEIKFKDYESFAQANLADVYSSQGLENALHLQAFNFENSYVENLGNGNFRISPLPMEAQFSSVNGILSGDLDKDGFLDLVLSGNLYGSEVETPRNDAGYGLFLKGDGKGNFKPLSRLESGLSVQGDVKKSVWIDNGGTRSALFAKNNDSIQLVRVLKK